MQQHSGSISTRKLGDPGHLELFVGASSEECVRRAKEFLVTVQGVTAESECWSDEELAAFAVVKTGAELTAWFNEQFPHYQYIERVRQLPG